MKISSYLKISIPTLAIFSIAWTSWSLQKEGLSQKTVSALPAIVSDPTVPLNQASNPTNSDTQASSRTAMATVITPTETFKSPDPANSLASVTQSEKVSGGENPASYETMTNNGLSTGHSEFATHTFPPLSSSSTTTQTQVAAQPAIPPQTPVPAGNQRTIDLPIEAITLPIPLLEPDPALSLNDQQKNGWQQQTEDFVKNVGGLDQNPADPKYLQTWQNAQWIADEQFRAMFGTDAFNGQQLRAAREISTAP